MFSAPKTFAGANLSFIAAKKLYEPKKYIHEL